MNSAVELISDTPTLRVSKEASFAKLYEGTFPMVARFIHSRKGTFDDAKDIFHDALVIYYEKQARGGLAIQVSEEAYILGIAKHLWLRKNKGDRKLVAIDTSESTIQIPDDYFTSFSAEHVLNFLARSGKKCLELLKSFYYDRNSTQEVTRAFGYKSLHSATVQKFKCLEKMREEVKQKSISYEDFLE